MFSDYKANVLFTYKKLRDSDQLKPNLARSTPAKLKSECSTVFSERYRKEDEITMRTFFGGQPNEAAYIDAIKKFDVDKFRPLDKFIKGGIRDTEDKNIELLAWLIDYPSRPYKFSLSSNLGPEANTSISLAEKIVQAKAEGVEEEIKAGSVDPVDEPEPEMVKPAPENEAFAEKAENNQPWKMFASKRVRNLLILTLAVISSVLGTYLIWRTTDKCMYWTGSRYVTSSCDVKLDNTSVIGLDTLKLNHFKKITRPDTITYYSLGKVWYLKASNICEFFTSDGFHPVHTERKLKPLTKVIVDNYVIKK